ncbi:MAG: serine hydrolase, partial [Robiginitalea sp.]
MRSRLATGYDASGQPLPYYRYPFEGAGSLMTTPSDLGIFLAAVMEDYRQEEGGRVIPHSMAQRVFARREGKLGFNKWYTDSLLVYRNDGSIPGFNGFLMGVPDRGQAVVVLANANSEAAYDLLNYVWWAVAMEYKWGYFEPYFYRRKEVAPPILDALSGQYENGRDTLAIRREAEGLVL